MSKRILHIEGNLIVAPQRKRGIETVLFTLYPPFPFRPKTLLTPSENAWICFAGPA